MGWKEKFTFRDKRYVEHEVAGTVFRFYPNRMGMLTEARELSAPVAKALNVLFADESRDSGSTVKRHRDGNFQMEDISTEPITPEMAAFRQKERDRAIDQLLGAVADPRSRLLLGKLFMDSLRDEFEYKADRTAAEVEEFLYGSQDGYQGLDTPVLVGLLRGWLKANAQVFGETGEKMVGLVRKRLADLQSASGSETMETTDPTSGSDSKSPSSPQSPQDSPLSTSIA